MQRRTSGFGFLPGVGDDPKGHPLVAYLRAGALVGLVFAVLLLAVEGRRPVEAIGLGLIFGTLVAGGLWLLGWTKRRRARPPG